MSGATLTDLPGDITRVLDRLREGERRAAESLLPLVYDELKNLAAARLRGERADHSLQSTDLVHEAWLRLGGNAQIQSKDRKHFFRTAAAVMRHVLVDHARHRNRQKRGSGKKPVQISVNSLAFEDGAVDMIALNEALEKLGEMAPRQLEVIELRFFAGLSNKEVAELLGLTERTTFTDWRLARAWLLREMGGA
jgi:RNA polymerase sigma factor (TIGR02999 family)